MECLGSQKAKKFWTGSKRMLRISVLRSLKELPTKVEAKTRFNIKARESSLAKLTLLLFRWLKHTKKKQIKIPNQSIQNNINSKLSVWRLKEEKRIGKYKDKKEYGRTSC